MSNVDDELGAEQRPQERYTKISIGMNACTDASIEQHNTMPARVPMLKPGHS